MGHRATITMAPHLAPGMAPRVARSASRLVTVMTNGKPLTRSRFLSEVLRRTPAFAAALGRHLGCELGCERRGSDPLFSAGP